MNFRGGPVLNFLSLQFCVHHSKIENEKTGRMRRRKNDHHGPIRQSAARNENDRPLLGFCVWLATIRLAARQCPAPTRGGISQRQPPSPPPCLAALFLLLPRPLPAPKRRPLPSDADAGDRLRFLRGLGRLPPLVPTQRLRSPSRFRVLMEGRAHPRSFQAGRWVPALCSHGLRRRLAWELLRLRQAHGANLAHLPGALIPSITSSSVANALA